MYSFLAIVGAGFLLDVLVSRGIRYAYEHFKAKETSDRETDLLHSVQHWKRECDAWRLQNHILIEDASKLRGDLHRANYLIGQLRAAKSVSVSSPPKLQSGRHDA